MTPLKNTKISKKPDVLRKILEKYSQLFSKHFQLDFLRLWPKMADFTMILAN